MNAEEIRQKAIEEYHFLDVSTVMGYEHGFADGVEEGKKQASLDNNIECGDCVRQITASDEERIRVDERNKTIDEARGALIKMRETCDAYGYDCDRCKNTYYSYHHSCADYFLEQMKGEQICGE